MSKEQLTVEFNDIARLLKSKGVQAKASNITSMPHTLYLVEKVITEYLPAGKIHEVYQILGFVQRALYGFGVFDHENVMKACPSLKLIQE